MSAEVRAYTHIRRCPELIPAILAGAESQLVCGKRAPVFAGLHAIFLLAIESGCIDMMRAAWTIMPPPDRPRLLWYLDANEYLDGIHALNLAARSGVPECIKIIDWILQARVPTPWLKIAADAAVKERIDFPCALAPDLLALVLEHLTAGWPTPAHDTSYFEWVADLMAHDDLPAVSALLRPGHHISTRVLLGVTAAVDEKNSCCAIIAAAIQRDTRISV